MAIRVEGHGFSIAHGAVSLNQTPISVGIPSAARAELERTTQGNTAVKTKAVAVLREYDNFSHTFPYDPVDKAALEAATGSVAHVITFPDSEGTLTIYASVASVGDVSLETDGRPTYDVEFVVTNLSGSTETAPVFSAGS